MPLKSVELKAGTGREAKAGNVVSVRYRGTFTDGKVFDETKGSPFRFPLGERVVIEGWDLGIAGMKVGGKRRLEIPPELAYGDEGSPPEIPPRSTLIFEVELLEVTDEAW